MALSNFLPVYTYLQFITPSTSGRQLSPQCASYPSPSSSSPSLSMSPLSPHPAKAKRPSVKPAVRPLPPLPYHFLLTPHRRRRVPRSARLGASNARNVRLVGRKVLPEARRERVKVGGAPGKGGCAAAVPARLHAHLEPDTSEPVLERLQ